MSNGSSREELKGKVALIGCELEDAASVSGYQDGVCIPTLPSQPGDLVQVPYLPGS